MFVLCASAVQSDCDSDVEDIINAAEQNPGLALRRLAGDGV